MFSSNLGEAFLKYISKKPNRNEKASFSENINEIILYISCSILLLLKRSNAISKRVSYGVKKARVPYGTAMVQ